MILSFLLLRRSLSFLPLRLCLSFFMLMLFFPRLTGREAPVKAYRLWSRFPWLPEAAATPTTKSSSDDQQQQQQQQQHFWAISLDILGQFWGCLRPSWAILGPKLEQLRFFLHLELEKPSQKHCFAFNCFWASSKVVRRDSRNPWKARVVGMVGP